MDVTPALRSYVETRFERLGRRVDKDCEIRVQLALAPATLYGFWLYGWPSIFLWLITIGAALFGEAACLKLAGRKAMPSLFDGSALVTGWLLAISLPPWAP